MVIKDLEPLGHKDRSNHETLERGNGSVNNCEM